MKTLFWLELKPHFLGSRTLSRQQKASQKNSRAKATDHRTVVARTRRERTRNKIITAAAKVFASKGTQAPVIDDFVQAAGVARGTFYYYFSTVEELLDATIAWSSDEVVRAIDAEISTYENAAERLATACRMYLKVAATDPAWCAFMAQLPHAGPFTQKRLKHDLQAGMQDGTFSLPDIEAGFDLVAGAMYRTLNRLVGRLPKKVNCDHAVIVILQGLGVKEPVIKQAISMVLPKLK